MLKLSHILKHYRGNTALKGVDLEFPRGEIVGLFGENGAGKTSLMKCVLGLVRYNGQVTLDGEEISRDNIAKISLATCEHSFFPNLTASGHKEFYAGMFPTFKAKRFDALMEFFELPLHKSVRDFSTGQKNQFEVILALSQGADYILMDEPFAGNDVFNREDFYKVLMGLLEPNETIILSTHLLEEVSGIISRAVLMHSGKIVGDVQVSRLEDEGKDLMDYVKEVYRYRSDRVSKALDRLTGES